MASSSASSDLNLQEELQLQLQLWRAFDQQRQHHHHHQLQLLLSDSELALQLQLRETMDVSPSHSAIARHELSGEITTTTTASSSAHHHHHHLHHRELRRVCPICLTSKPPRRMLSLPGCSHEFCRSCLARHADTKLKERKIPPCPSPGCHTILAPEQCQQFLSSESYDKLIGIWAEAKIPELHKVHCPYPGCSELFDGSLLGPSEVSVECLRCHRLFCVKCRVPWHDSVSCTAYQKIPPEQREAADAELYKLAKKQHWKTCKKCGSMIALTHGCYHMTCKCGHEFCYHCGAKWKTCECKLWDERNLIRAQRRRHR